MNLYLDTSALVKVYIYEDSSEEVRKKISESKAVMSSTITYLEARSAFSRLKREKRLSDIDYSLLKKELEKDWKDYLILAVTDSLIQKASLYCEAFELRAYDSLHLASADYLQTKSGEALIFACFDAKLNQAAIEIGMETL